MKLKSNLKWNTSKHTTPENQLQGEDRDVNLLKAHVSAQEIPGRF